MGGTSIGSVHRLVCRDEAQELLQVETENTEGCASMDQGPR